MLFIWPEWWGCCLSPIPALHSSLFKAYAHCLNNAFDSYPSGNKARLCFFQSGSWAICSAIRSHDNPHWFKKWSWKTLVVDRTLKPNLNLLKKKSNWLFHLACYYCLTGLVENCLKFDLSLRVEIWLIIHHTKLNCLLFPPIGGYGDRRGITWPQSSPSYYWRQRSDGS